jgi:hypothetical protein
VFGIVSPSFGGTEAKHPGKSAPQAPAVTSSSPKDLYAQAHDVTAALIHSWESFDLQRGDWSRADVQQDLSQLRVLVDTYIQRGTTTSTS